MPPKQAKTDSRGLTLLFRKHRTTVLLSLQPHETLDSTKEKLLAALKSRDLSDINADPIPDNPENIEFGIPVDRSDLEKGWTPLGAIVPNPDTENLGRSSKAPETLLAAGLDDGHSIAFRFRKPGKSEQADENNMVLDLDDPGWDVVLPKFEEEEEV